MCQKECIRFQLTQGACWDEIVSNSLINFLFAHDFSITSQSSVELV